jgi:sugar lactone lactonase YvrE
MFRPSASRCLILAAGFAAQAAPLRYVTSWLGNSFGGGPEWVQNFNEQLQVLPDGTAYLASFWDEAGREVGIYRAGRPVGRFEHTHMRGGFAVAVGGGHAWYAQTSVREDQPEVKAGEARREKPVCYFGLGRYTPDGKVAPFPGGGTRFKNLLVLREGLDDHAQIPRGLAADDRFLYVADTAADRLRVFDHQTFQPVREFAVERPVRVAVAPGGDLWVLSGGHVAAQDFRPDGPAGRLRCFTPAGEPRPVTVALPAEARPAGLNFGADGLLYVADQGRRAQVHVFDVRAGPAKLVRTVGDEGGLYAGPEPGRAGPYRFAGLTGAATDAAGNLHVAMNVPRGGTVLRTFAPDGALKHEALNLEFVDTADADPAGDGRDVFTADGWYRLDPAAPAAAPGWAWHAQTLEPFRYPHDLRRHVPGLQCGTQVRRLNGQRFLCLRGMWQGVLGIYRFDGALAVPAAVLSVGPVQSDSGAFRPPGQPAEGRWLWRDADGDGQMEAGEYAASAGPAGEYWASNVDAAGDLWQGGRSEGIWRWRFTGLDARGVPHWQLPPQHEPMPAPFTDLLRTDYQPETDVMYLTGQTKERELTGGEWGTAGTVVARYDDWSKPARALRYAVPVPYEAGKTFQVSFAVAGELFFTVDCKTAAVSVYAAADGRPLGTLRPGPEVHGESGWVDFRDALRATRRRDGGYLVFVEEDWKGKVLAYRLADPLAAAP